MAVRVGHLQLVLEVRAAAHAAHDHARAVLAAGVDDQARGLCDLDAALALEGLAQEGAALLGIEEPALRGMSRNEHDDLAEEFARAQHEVEVSEGDGVEAARKEGATARGGIAHTAQLSPWNARRRAPDLATVRGSGRSLTAPEPHRAGASPAAGSDILAGRRVTREGPKRPLEVLTDARSHLARPLVALVAVAFAAGAASRAGAAVVVCVGLALVFFAPRRAPGGLSAAALAVWFLVAGLHATAPPGDAESGDAPSGVWQEAGALGEGVRGTLGARGLQVELPTGVAGNGEHLELVGPTRTRQRAGGPAFASGSQPPPPVLRVEADQVRRLAAPVASVWDTARRAARALRRRGLERVEGLERPATRGLVGALVFGDRSVLPPGLADLFTRTGTRHALAVSGLHVGIIAALLIWPLGAAFATLAARLLPTAPRARWLRQPAPWRALLLALVVPVSGSGAPVLRAALALGLAELASVLRAPDARGGAWPRRADALSLWSLALAFEWVVDPRCTHSISVLLSYGATLGLLLHARPLHAWVMRHLPGEGRLAPVGRLGHPRPRLVVVVAQRGVDLLVAGLAASAAANLATLPIVWHVFGEWSWVGCLATLVVLPWLAVFLAAAWIWVVLPVPGLEALLDQLVAGLLAALEAFDDLPATPLALPRRAPLLLGLVGALGLLAARGAAWRWSALAGWLALLVPRSTAEEVLEVYALDVGHGTAVVVRPPRGPTWLFDAGSRDRSGVAREAVAPLLRALEVRELVVVCSHGEADHAGALPWIVARFPPRAWGGALPAQVAERLPHGAPRLDAGEGRVSIALDAGREELRGVLVRGLAVEGNEGSRDLELTWRGRRLLLCGDAEGRGRGRMLARGEGRGPYDLLLFPHHGSDTPWLGPLLEAARPREVWISAAGRPAVADELDRRGLPWRCTHAEGALVTRLAPAGNARLAREPGMGSGGPARFLRSSGTPSDGPAPEPDLRGPRHDRTDPLSGPLPAAPRPRGDPGGPRAPGLRPARDSDGLRAARHPGGRARPGARPRGPP